jgi:hypothetical protein
MTQPFENDASKAGALKTQGTRRAEDGRKTARGNSIEGSAEGKTKSPPCQRCSEGLRKSSGKLEKLFSSFLRGASCPKSPRFSWPPSANSPPHRSYILYA